MGWDMSCQTSVLDSENGVLSRERRKLEKSSKDRLGASGAGNAEPSDSDV